MNYTIETNLKLVPENKHIELLNKFQEILDRDYSTIKFSRNIKALSLVDMLNKFFYEKRATLHTVNGSNQCFAGRARSAIDFYLLQKYYLEEPMSMVECWNIYLRLPRDKEGYIESYMKNPYFMRDEKDQDKKLAAASLNFHSQVAMYYCSTVKRQVFNKYGYGTLLPILKEEFKNDNPKMKTFKEVKKSKLEEVC